MWTEAHLKGREDLNCLLMSQAKSTFEIDKENGGGTKVQEPELVS